MKRTKFPIELICSKYQLRPAMTGVLIDNGYAIATDAHVLVIMSLKDMQMSCLSELDGKIIKAEVFKKINNSKLYVNVFDGKIDIDGDIIGSPFIDERFPDYRCVIPTKNGDIGIIGFDAEKMANIQKAFGCRSLRVSFGESCSRAMSIKPDFSVSHDFQAICMPVCIDAPDNSTSKPFTLKTPEYKQLETA